jgi:hypothetical protein
MMTTMPKVEEMGIKVAVTTVVVLLVEMRFSAKISLCSGLRNN